MIKIKKNKTFSNLNKKFGDEMRKRIKIKETRDDEMLYNIISMEVDKRVALSLTKAYNQDMQKILLDEIDDTIEKLSTMTSDELHIIEFRDKKINELRGLRKQISEIDNGGQSLGYSERS